MEYKQIQIIQNTQ